MNQQQHCITLLWTDTCVLTCIMYCVHVYVEVAPTAALFINTSVGLTVRSRREREPWDSLEQRPHKKSLLIYFPPNRKVHAHTWLNHHTSTGDGPPLHADETQSQFCRAGPSQARQRKHSVMLHTYTLFNDFCRCAAPDSSSKALSSPLHLQPTHSIWPLLAIWAWSNFSFHRVFCGSRGLHMPSCSFPPTYPPHCTPLLFFHSHFSISFPLHLYICSCLPCLICHSATRSEKRLLDSREVKEA